MATLTQLPDLAKSFKKLKLILDLREKANPNTSIGFAIISAIDSKSVQTNEILQYAKEQAQDCLQTMIDCIGDELTERILNY